MKQSEPIDREAFWSAVHGALDAGADPLEVELVQDWIADHPNDGDDLARLLQRLHVVASAPKRTPRKVAFAAAGAALVAASVVLLAVHFAKRPPVEPAPEPRSRIVQYTLEVVRECAGSSSSVVVGTGRITQSRTALVGATIIVSSVEGNLP